MSCCAAPLARCGEGKRAAPAPGSVAAPVPSGLSAKPCQEVLCCILSRSAGATLPAPSSSSTAAHRGSPDLVSCCWSWPQPAHRAQHPAHKPLRLGTHWSNTWHLLAAREAQPLHPACGCRHGAVQQAKHHRGVSDGLGQDPQPLWTSSALLWQHFQAGTEPHCQLGRGQAPCSLP